MATPDLSIEQVPFDSPAAQAMILCAEEELDRRYGPETDRIALDPDSFNHPNGAFWVARDGEDLAGAVGLRRLDETHSEIKRLWVRPDLRRAGVARTLMAAAELCAIELGYPVVVLETGPRQPEAVAFYAKEGWEQVAELPIRVSHYDESIRFLKRFS